MDPILLNIHIIIGNKTYKLKTNWEKIILERIIYDTIYWFVV